MTMTEENSPLPPAGPTATRLYRVPRPATRNPLRRYMHWLHTMWPAGDVEKLPVVREDGSTNVPGVYVVGDLAGVPLLKFSADTGAKAAQRIAADPALARDRARLGDDGVADVAIVGGGTAGYSAALEARKLGLRFVLIESAEPFSTVVNFPKGKLIFTYPTQMTPAGDLRFTAGTKEELLEELRAQTRGIEPVRGRATHITRHGGVLQAELEDGQPIRALRVIIAIGRSGNHRKLDVPGEDLPKVYNRLHDPRDFAGQRVLVVGGGDSALEAAIALAEGGADVTLSYRGAEFSRPKPDNIERLQRMLRDPQDHEQIEQPQEHETTAVGDFVHEQEGAAMPPRGSIRLLMRSRVVRIEEDAVELTIDGGQTMRIGNDVVFTMIGYDPPLDFFRRSGIRIRNERSPRWWITLMAFLLACFWMYHWKKTGVTVTGIEAIDRWLDVGSWWSANGWFPANVPAWLATLGEAWRTPSNLLGTLRISMGEAGFWYSVAYCAAVVGFGIDRVIRKPTPYIRIQTAVLAAIQVIPLFLLPYILLPWMGHNGWFDNGVGRWFADTFFPVADYTEHGREYWRAFGFILAWPLFIWNVFNYQPLWGWLIVSFVQTFVVIPVIVYFWGKGAYCGWICSCGALAETMGDRHRTKMPHGPLWNRLNMIGQGFLAFAMVLLVLRGLAWAWPQSVLGQAFDYLFSRLPLFNYVWFVDLLWAGIIGVGMYFWFSGRVWCRFACPLAALMHIYHRFSRFRIIPDKKRCISCNVCTTVCHQGIDVMNFANKGLAMADPQCVRCSACVESCPTGVLEFGQINPKTGQVIRKDPAWLAASPVLIRESEVTVNGKRRG